MAMRPLAFGVRLRDRGRTVAVRPHPSDARRYVLEDSTAGRGPGRRREHDSLGAALRDLAATWRSRLN